MSKFMICMLSVVFTLGFWVWFSILLATFGWTGYSIAILIIAAAWSILSIDNIVTTAIDYTRH